MKVETEVPLVSEKSNGVSVLFAGDLDLAETKKYTQQPLLATVNQAFFISVLGPHWGFFFPRAPND